MHERSAISWNTFSSRIASRPAIAMISISASQPAIHSAAIGFGGGAVHARMQIGSGEGRPVSASLRRDLQRANLPTQRCTRLNFAVGSAA